MRHYHRTPLAGGAEEATNFLRNRHALIPFSCTEEVAIAFDVCRSVAFEQELLVVSKNGNVPRIDAYIDWCADWHRHPGFDWALIPAIKAGATAENDALLRDWPSDICGIPVYQLHEDPQRLVRLASDYPVVALSGGSVWPNPGTSGWWSRMATIMDVICDEQGRPLCKLHGLQMLTPDIFTVLPLASADGAVMTLNLQSAKRFGSYDSPSVSQRALVIADRIEAHNSAAIWQRPDQQLLYHGPQQLAL